ncbi:3-methyl-2-oxobutanoate hydroxymethyltransferase [Candidatus Schneideria nysicola]|uniref:3-methyl-2-oxobutanoate hydroxymethyltransferase n=1 Tax=Candidatus Schneideria nysicola TaxID=1081631 RepID=UPI001CAA7572|nr:3-methyl-2-oxobutanoate hydroxymethyltransferase [Candidatus Schneideria nysicola]UAJ66221.1 3-methyl-2-oxobutanoate hydroxymethyltransferase [Candidatus Schneideria nysicola]
MKKSITISNVQSWKQKRKFAVITAYDASFAHLFALNGIEVILVGDSLGMTIQGHNSTIPVTLKEMIYHTRCVRRGAPSCFLLADLPFMTYTTWSQACDSAAKLMRVGANMIKLEGGSRLTGIIKKLTIQSIPVCGHIGLTPQSVNILGGYKIQGRDKDSAEILLNDAIALEKAGIQLLVLECVPIELAKNITQSLKIPVIGIGSGSYTDGQILVMQDILGITDKHAPSFAKNFLLQQGGSIAMAIQLYIKEVETGLFPSIQYSFH